MKTEDVIQAAVKAYDEGDGERVSTLIADAIHYQIHGAEGFGCYRCDTHDAPSFWDAVSKIQADWEIKSYRLVDLICEGERGAAQIAIEMTSRHTGKHVSSGLALFLTVRNGQIVELHEYHDTAAAGSSRD